jgi:glutamine synthetase
MQGHKAKGAKTLPLNLLDAVRNFSRNKMFREALGTEVCDAFVKLKTAEWNQYCRQLTQWERETTLDC